MFRLLLTLNLVVLSGLPGAAQMTLQQATQQPPRSLPPWAIVVQWESQWQVTAGAHYRFMGSVDWTTGSYSPAVAVSLIQPGIDLPRPRPRGIYADGYVLPDGSTAVDGLTGVWGYSSDAQVQDDALLFQSTAYDSTLAKSVRDGDGSEEMHGMAPFVSFDWQGLKKLTSWGMFRAGVQGSLSVLPLDFHRTTRTVSALLREEEVAIVDRYELNGLVPPLAPYAGTVGGAGPVIDATPDGRREGVRRLLLEQSFSNDIQQDLEVIMTSISLGPTLEWQGREEWALQGSLGLALNVLRWEATQTENFINESNGQALASWEDAADGTKVLPGFYLQLAVQRRLSTHWWCQLMGRYDWIGTLHERVGPSGFSLDLNGWTVGAGFVWRW